MVNEAHVAASTSAGSPVGYIVNVFPLCACFPGAIALGLRERPDRFWPAFLPGGGFKREARECRDLTVKVVDLLTAQLVQHRKKVYIIQFFYTHLYDLFPGQL